MCGRYSIVSTAQEIAAHYNVENNATDFTPNPNISIGEHAPVITCQNPQKLLLLTFGFTPFWVQKPSYIINARSEGDFNKSNSQDYSGAMGIVSKPMFKHAIKSKRCLIPFNAFIEGPQKEKLKKPYLIQFNNIQSIHSFAGIYDEWINKESGEILQGYAIITTTANSITQRIGHHRSPVILTHEEEVQWLNVSTNVDTITQILKPWKTTKEDLLATPISSKIQKASCKTIDILTNDPTPLANSQLDLFK